jgi:acyl CoA:acetate/3-ketoacid CoA transferase alpha subunit
MSMDILNGSKTFPQVVKSIPRALLVVLSLCSTPAVLQHILTAAANSPAPATATAIGQDECRDMDPKLARERAVVAFRKAQYREAAQCYLMAGDKPRADLAFIKAAAADAPIAKRQLAANANQVKAQFRQLREAFTSH